MIQESNSLQSAIKEAFEKAPVVYANGFVNGLGTADVYVVLQINGQNLLVVNLSHSMAKTLGQSLLSQVERYEKLTGQEVPTLQEMSQLVMDSL